MTPDAECGLARHKRRRATPLTMTDPHPLMVTGRYPQRNVNISGMAKINESDDIRPIAAP